jgi:hypothetical protein
MDHLTKEQIQALVKLERELPSLLGVFDLYVKGFGTNIEVSIALGNNESCDLSDRTVQTINEIADLTEDHYKHILRLLFDDAMIQKEESAWGDTTSPPEAPPSNWLRRLFSRPDKFRFVALAADDPRHPLFGINTPEDIAARIKWEGFYVDDDQESVGRIAFLTCHPAWEEEHGREIAIRNGVPVGINGIELNPYFYEEEEYDESIEEDIRVRIWSGFHSLSDVLSMIEDSDWEGDRNRLAEFARSEFRAKREAEAAWPAVTDCDRLDEAFDSLNNAGIIALHNAGLTMSEGISDVSEELANCDPETISGYCFYHEQDVGRAIDGYGLNVAFGDIEDTESGKREIGRLVKAELERHGFTVAWDDNPNTRLDITKIVWQRRTPYDE